MPLGPIEQEGVRNAAAAIGGKKRRLGVGMAEQRVGQTRGRRFLGFVRGRAHDATFSSTVAARAGWSPEFTAFHTCLGDLFLRRGCIDDHAALRLRCGERKVRLAQLVMKIDCLCLETIGICAAAPPRRPLQSQCGGYIEDEREIGIKVADGYALERLDQALIDFAERPLIDARGIGEAIANDPVARFERRQDGAADMVVAGSGEQHRFRLRPERLCRAG